MTRILLPTLFLAVTLPVPAFAQDAAPVLRVAHGDLNLATAAGIRALDGRIADAIEAACPGDDSADLRRKLTAARCRQAKRDEVSAQRAQVLAAAARQGTVIASAR